jgi:hypothetical protein
MPDGKKYNDPYWVALAKNAEARTGIPPGLLQSILVNGEKTNPGVISSAGAKTPFQIIPGTRDGILKKHGIDPYLNDQNAAIGAALLLKESLDRNGGKIDQAVGEYHGGINRKAWGPINVAYRNRVMSGLNADGTVTQVSSKQAKTAPIAQNSVPRVNTGGAGSTGTVGPLDTSKLTVIQKFNLLKSGRLPPAEAKAFSDAVQAGEIMLPTNITDAEVAKIISKPLTIQPSVWRDYNKGDLPREQMIELESMVKNGRVIPPKGQMMDTTQMPTTMEKVGNWFTGSIDQTEKTKTLRDVTDMPEMNFGAKENASLKTTVGTALTSRNEWGEILKKQFPNIKTDRDTKGNLLIQSPSTGEWFVSQPGLNANDVVNFASQAAPFVATGGTTGAATTVGKAAVKSALTQTGIEAARYGSTGEFNPSNILMAGVGEALAPVVSKVGRAVVNTVTGAKPGIGNAITSALKPEITAATNAAERPIVADVANIAADVNPAEFNAAKRAIDAAPVEPMPLSKVAPEPTTLKPLAEGDTVTLKGDPNAVPVTVVKAETANAAGDVGHALVEHADGTRTIVPHGDIAPHTPIPEGAPIPAVATQTAEQVAGQADNIAPFTEPPAPIVGDMTNAEQFTKQLRQAVGNSKSAQEARQALADSANINPEAKAAFEKIGVQVPVDVMSDNELLKQELGAMRGMRATDTSVQWAETMREARQAADVAIEKIGATTDRASMSQVVHDAVVGQHEKLKQTASDMYQAVNDVVPREMGISTPNLAEELRKISAETGGKLFPMEKQILADIEAEGGMTYGGLLRAKQQIGAAMESHQFDSNFNTESLKRLYGATAKDQLHNVERVGGAELRDKLVAANDVFSSSKKLEDGIKSAFGRDSEGSIAGLLKTAISSAKEGDITKLTKLLDIVPENLKRETVATALFTAARDAQGGFGFAQFASLYPKLRANAPVYAKIIRALGGGDSDEFLRNLYTVSRRISDANGAYISRTGASNQPLLQGLMAEGLAAKILNSTVGKLTATGAGAVGAGPVGSVLASAAVSALSAGKKDIVKEAAKMLNSQEFLDLATAGIGKQSVDQIKPAAIKRLAMAPKFAEFLKRTGQANTLSEREQWIKAGLITATTSANSAQTEGDK